MDYAATIETVGKVIDASGVAITALGIASAGVVLVARSRTRSLDGATRYRDFRQNVGRSILLGLELLVAGDIIRTVAAKPSFRSVGVLAVIVAIRTFLSFTLEVELTGRWPWRRAVVSDTAPNAPVDGAAGRPEPGTSA